MKAWLPDVGLWTKADSVIYFDDLTVKDLGTTKGLIAPCSGKAINKAINDTIQIGGLR